VIDDDGRTRLTMQQRLARTLGVFVIIGAVALRMSGSVAFGLIGGSVSAAIGFVLFGLPGPMPAERRDDQR
jgi:hypothetical protein